MIKNPKLKLSENIIFRQLDRDDGILINLSTKNYYSLNESACLIVKSLKNGEQPKEILKKMVTRLGAPKNTAKIDLFKILDRLKKDQIIIQS